jgi:hypothetical protein
MQKRKIVNYIAGVVALIHAGVTSRMMQETLLLPDVPSQLSSPEQMQQYADSLPDAYIGLVALFFLTGSVLFIFGLVTLRLNWQLDRTVRIRRLAVRTSILTLGGVFISLFPLINVVYPVVLSICFIISGYFMPQEGL